MADDVGELSDGFDSLTGGVASKVAPTPVKIKIPATEAKQIADVKAHAAAARDQFEAKVRTERGQLNEELNDAKLAVVTAEAGAKAAEQQYQATRQEEQKVVDQQTRAEAELKAAEKSGDVAGARKARHDIQTAEASLDRIDTTQTAAKADRDRFNAEASEQTANVNTLQAKWKTGEDQLRAAETEIGKMEQRAASLQEAAEQRVIAADAQRDAAFYGDQPGGSDLAAEATALAAKASKAATAAQADADAQQVDHGALQTAGITDDLPPQLAPVDLNDADALAGRAAALRAKYLDELKSDERVELSADLNALEAKVKAAPKAIEAQQQEVQEASRAADMALKRAAEAEQRATNLDKAKDPIAAREAREIATTERANALTASRVADRAAEDLEKVRTDTAAQTTQRDALKSQLETETKQLVEAERSIDAIEDRARLVKSADTNDSVADTAAKQAEDFRKSGNKEQADTWQKQADEFRAKAKSERAQADAKVIDEDDLKAAGLAPGAPSTGPLSTNLADGSDSMLEAEAASLGQQYASADALAADSPLAAVINTPTAEEGGADDVTLTAGSTTPAEVGAPVDAGAAAEAEAGGAAEADAPADPGPALVDHGDVVGGTVAEQIAASEAAPPEVTTPPEAEVGPPDDGGAFETEQTAVDDSVGTFAESAPAEAELSDASTAYEPEPEPELSADTTTADDAPPDESFPADG